MVEQEMPWDDESVSLCANCTKHPEILALIESDLAEGVCGICASHFEKVFNPKNFQKMVNLFRALIRFHFNEDQYNPHWGGTSIQSLLLSEENPLVRNATSDDYIDAFIIRIEEEGGVYPDFDKGICLYAGSDADGLRGLQFSLQETICRPLRDIEQGLRYKNFHLIEPEMEALLSRVENDLVFWIDEGSLWFRSRTGVREESYHVGEGKVTHIAVPFKGNEIGAPPPSANAGRANRQGVSVLYLASDIDTALSEIRPHPGHLISVGGFRSTERLRIASFDQPISRFASCDQRLDDFSVLHHVDALLRAPVVPEERHRYAATQLLSDCLIRRGFDGIAFGSSVGTGSNICIFNAAKFRFDESQSYVRRVDALSYSFSDVTMRIP